MVLKQDGPWTYGALVNHLWDVAGDDSRDSVNATFLQPFLSYILPTKTTLTLNTETTYDWSNDQWTVPLNFQSPNSSKSAINPCKLSSVPATTPEPDAVQNGASASA